MLLHCADKNRFVSVFGQDFNFVQIARVNCSKKGPLSKPVSLLLSKVGVKNCRYGFHDVFRGPDVSPASLRHLAVCCRLVKYLNFKGSKKEKWAVCRFLHIH